MAMNVYYAKQHLSFVRGQECRGQDDPDGQPLDEPSTSKPSTSKGGQGSVFHRPIHDSSSDDEAKESQVQMDENIAAFYQEQEENKLVDDPDTDSYSDPDTSRYPASNYSAEYLRSQESGVPLDVSDSDLDISEDDDVLEVSGTELSNVEEDVAEEFAILRRQEEAPKIVDRGEIRDVIVEPILHEIVDISVKIVEDYRSLFPVNQPNPLADTLWNLLSHASGDSEEEKERKSDEKKL